MALDTGYLMYFGYWKPFNWQELGHQASLIRKVAEKVFSAMGVSISYKIGTMIEIPRAALVADEVRYEILC